MSASILIKVWSFSAPRTRAERARPHSFKLLGNHDSSIQYEGYREADGEANGPPASICLNRKKRMYTSFSDPQAYTIVYSNIVWIIVPIVYSSIYTCAKQSISTLYDGSVQVAFTLVLTVSSC